jgi:hypothetical protein
MANYDDLFADEVMRECWKRKAHVIENMAVCKDIADTLVKARQNWKRKAGSLAARKSHRPALLRCRFERL